TEGTTIGVASSFEENSAYLWGSENMLGTILTPLGFDWSADEDAMVEKYGNADQEGNKSGKAARSSDLPRSARQEPVRCRCHLRRLGPARRLRQAHRGAAGLSGVQGPPRRQGRTRLPHRQGHDRRLRGRGIRPRSARAGAQGTPAGLT